MTDGRVGREGADKRTDLAAEHAAKQEHMANEDGEDDERVHGPKQQHQVELRQYSYGLCSYGLHSYGLCSYVLCGYGL